MADIVLSLTINDERFALQPHGWMGKRLPDVNSDLWKEYRAKLSELQVCCDDHSAPGCIVSPIENLKQWLERQDAALNQTMSEEGGER